VTLCLHFNSGVYTFTHWYIAKFPSCVRISCITPRLWRVVRIATIVDGLFQRFVQNSNIGVRVGMFQAPRLTGQTGNSCADVTLEIAPPSVTQTVSWCQFYEKKTFNFQLCTACIYAVLMSDFCDTVQAHNMTNMYRLYWQQCRYFSHTHTDGKPYC
jgi:hypothetical protein